MRLKLDENLSRHLKPVLIALGHDVLTAADEDLLSSPDVQVAACAAREDRMLLTLDIEFADLRKYPPGSHPGIMLFRPASLGPLSVNLNSPAAPSHRVCAARPTRVETQNLASL